MAVRELDLLFSFMGMRVQRALSSLRLPLLPSCGRAAGPGGWSSWCCRRLWSVTVRPPDFLSPETAQHRFSAPCLVDARVVFLWGEDRLPGNNPVQKWVRGHFPVGCVQERRRRLAQPTGVCTQTRSPGARGSPHTPRSPSPPRCSSCPVGLPCTLALKLLQALSEAFVSRQGVTQLGTFSCVFRTREHSPSNRVLPPLVSLLTGPCLGPLGSSDIRGQEPVPSSPASGRVVPGAADLSGCGRGEAWVGIASERLGGPVVLGPLPQAEPPSCSFVPRPA